MRILIGIIIAIAIGELAPAKASVCEFIHSGQAYACGVGFVTIQSPATTDIHVGDTVTLAINFALPGDGATGVGNWSLQFTDPFQVQSQSQISATSFQEVGSFTAPDPLVSVGGNFIDNLGQVGAICYATCGSFFEVLPSNVSAVPESSTWAMLLIGFAAIGHVSYRKKATARSA
jgi:hypothetical protein